VPAPTFTEQDVLQLAASIDQGSEHPPAQAIVTEAGNRGMTLTKPESFESSSGIGVRDVVDGKRIALGNTVLMESEHVDWRILQADADALHKEDASVMFLARDGVLVGLIAVSDPVKATTPEALATLKCAPG
jgi:Cu+-exporting ATPase